MGFWGGGEVVKNGVEKNRFGFLKQVIKVNNENVMKVREGWVGCIWAFGKFSRKKRCGERIAWVLVFFAVGLSFSNSLIISWVKG